MTGVKNNGSLNSNRKWLTVKPFASRRDNFVQVKYRKPHDVLAVKIASWNIAETRIVASILQTGLVISKI